MTFLLLILTTNASAFYLVETNPFILIGGGESITIGKELGNFRLKIGAIQSELPDFLLENDDFTVDRVSYSFSIDYFGKSPEWYFFGIGFSTFTDDFSIESSPNETEITGTSMSLRLGFRYTLFSSFYIQPRMTYSTYQYSEDPKIVQISNQDYELPDMSFSSTIQLGVFF